MIKFLKEFERSILTGEFDAKELYTLLDEVINVCTIEKSNFAKELSELSLPVQDAFTKIALKFITNKSIDFKRGANFYDGRNNYIVSESSIISKYISSYHFSFEDELTALEMINDILPVANLDQLDKYLFLIDVTTFTNRISNAHRTLQNNFGYLVKEWILLNLTKGNDIFPVSLKYLDELGEDNAKEYLKHKTIS